MICPNCKKEVDDEEVLCPNCSYNIQADKKESAIVQLKKELNKKNEKYKKYSEMERELNPIIRVMLKLIYFTIFFFFLVFPIVIIDYMTPTKEIYANFVSYRETTRGYVALYKYEANDKEEYFEVLFSDDKNAILDKYPVLIQEKIDKKTMKIVAVFVMIGTISITAFARNKLIKIFYKMKLKGETQT